jgi:phage shock protein PspC (stress-responsive transcriptional regulator)
MIIKALIFDKNALVAFIWTVFLVLYIILLIIMHVMVKNWEKKAKLMQNLKILF